MMKTITKLFIGMLMMLSLELNATQVIKFEPTREDMTLAVREALESATDKNVKLIFAKGTYYFTPEYATDRYYAVTNHNNGFKRVVFQIENFESVEIVGNASSFVFSGQVAPFIFENCSKITMSGLSIDWDIPFSFQGEITGFSEKENWWDVKPADKGFSWKVKGGRLLYPNVDGFYFAHIGHTYAFDPVTKDVVYGVKGMHPIPYKIEVLANGNIRFYEKFQYCPPVGSIISSCGDGSETRYAPGVYVKSSSNIVFDGIKVHHALGMGFLFERADNVVLKNSGVHLSEGSNRVVSALADATHFCNCKGDVLVENCRFENMLDDGTNVHGTYVFVDEVLSSKKVRIAIRHKQQTGFEFAKAGDEVWFIHHPHVARADVNKVVSVKRLNDVYAELNFENDFAQQPQVGDALENRTWNPSFTMSRCSIGNHRARNVVLKSPLKTVIENNRFFSSDMASILFRGESLNWFESGAVKDVLIRNNYFSYCNHGNYNQPVLFISPRTGKTYSQDEPYDKNIRFVNNTIETFGNRIVLAERVDGLVFKGNIIKQTNEAKPLFPDAPVFDFRKCLNIELSNNTYNGSVKEIIKADEASKARMKVKGNKGF